MSASGPSGPLVFLFYNIFMKFCLCIFEIDTVKSDSPVQIFRKMIKCSKI